MIHYVDGLKGRTSPARIRSQMEKALGYGLDVELVGNLTRRAQQALLKFTESRKVSVTLKTSSRVSKELEARASVIEGKCRPIVSPKMIGLVGLDLRAAIELSRLVGGNVVSGSGRRLDLEETRDPDLDERVEFV